MYLVLFLKPGATYTDLFGPENDHDLHIEQSVWDELPKVSESENEDLCKPFSELEIKEASFQMEKNKAVGPDKIPIEFYQTCWDIAKSDIIQLFADFMKIRLTLVGLTMGSSPCCPKNQMPQQYNNTGPSAY